MQTVTVPTDVKASWAQTINGVSYAADARIEYADVEFLARTNALSAYLSNGSLYLSPTPNGQDAHKAGRTVPVGLNVKVLNALLAQEQTQDVPAAPTGLSAVAAGATTVTISFTPGAAGGAPITNYEYKVGTSAWTALDPADASSPVSVPVDGGASGNIRLRAVNLHGSGVQSDQVAYSVVLPDPPTAIAGDVTGNSLAITFTPPAAGGTVTTYAYRIGQTDLTQNPWVTVTPDDATSPITVDVSAYGTPALTPILGENLRLKAVNNAGESAVVGPVVIT